MHNTTPSAISLLPLTRDKCTFFMYSMLIIISSHWLILEHLYEQSTDHSVNPQKGHTHINTSSAGPISYLDPLQQSFLTSSDEKDMKRHVFFLHTEVVLGSDVLVLKA